MISFTVEDAFKSKLPKKAHSFYRERLAPNVVAAFDAILEASRDDQLEILEEIALLRECAGHTVELYSQARASAIAKPSANADALVLHASIIMRDALNEVIQAVSVAKKMDAGDKNKFNLTTFSFFVGRMIAAVNDSGVDLDGARRINEAFENLINDFDDEINNQNKPNNHTVTGIVLRPDQTCIEMDSTVPSNN